MVTAAQARAWLDRMVSAWNRHDAAAVAACYAPEAVIITAGEAGPLEGLDVLIDTLEMLFEGFPDIQHDVRSTVFGDNCVAMEWSLRGTHTGLLPSPTGFLAATGRAIEVPGVSFIWLDEQERAVREHSYTDPTTMARQLGLYHQHDDHDDHDDDHEGHGHGGQPTLDMDPDGGPSSGYGR